MNPSSNVSTQDFSSCTIGKICEAFPQLGKCLEGMHLYNTYIYVWGSYFYFGNSLFSLTWQPFLCLFYFWFGSCNLDPGSRTIATLQMCGNGIKEDGEDCDPGGNNSTCCDASTCKFINNAKCE